MKSRRILAAVLAPVCAVSAMAVVASAESEFTTVTGNGSPESGNILIGSALDGIDATAVAKVVVTLDSTSNGGGFNGCIGLNNADGDWTASSQLDYTAESKEWSFDVDGVPDVSSLQVQVWWMDGAEWNNDTEQWDGDATISVESVKFLDKDGNELKAPADDESSDSEPTTSDDTSSDDTSSDDTSSDDTSSDDPAGDDTSSDDPAGDDTSSDNTSSDDPAVDNTSSDVTNSDTTPGATDKADEITNAVIVDKVLKGADLSKAVFGDSKKTWKDVESITFESDDPFAVVFDVKAGKVKGDDKATTFVKGVNELVKAELPEEAFATKWTLSADEVAAMLEADPEGANTQLISKDGKKITVTAKVTLKAAAAGDDDNKPTGIALAVAPVILAGAAVAVVTLSKKRK